MPLSRIHLVSPSMPGACHVFPWTIVTLRGIKADEKTASEQVRSD
jgi:hypothetical protein